MSDSNLGSKVFQLEKNIRHVSYENKSWYELEFIIGRTKLTFNNKIIIPPTFTNDMLSKLDNNNSFDEKTGSFISDQCYNSLHIKYDGDEGVILSLYSFVDDDPNISYDNYFHKTEYILTKDELIQIFQDYLEFINKCKKEYMVHFVLYPGTYQPAELINISRAREFKVELISKKQSDFPE